MARFLFLQNTAKRSRSAVESRADRKAKLHNIFQHIIYPSPKCVRGFAAVSSQRPFGSGRVTRANRLVYKDKVAHRFDEDNSMHLQSSNEALLDASRHILSSNLLYSGVLLCSAITQTFIAPFSRLQAYVIALLLGLLLVQQSQSCYDDCSGNRTRLVLAPDYRRAEYNNSNCFCDKLCAVYGDCCHDKQVLMGSRSRMQFKCGPLTGAFTLSGLPLSVYYVHKCADSVDADTQRKCEAPELTSGDISQRLPVHLRTESQGLLVFRNRHCALCNGVTQYEMWNAALSNSLPIEAKEVWSQQVGKNLTAAAIYAALLTGNLSVLGPSWGVAFKPKLPADEDVLPYCKPTEEISACSNNQASYAACMEGPVAYRYREKERTLLVTYRNSHCVLCAGVKNAKACHQGRPQRTSNPPMSLTILFDMVDDLPMHMRAIGSDPLDKRPDEVYYAKGTGMQTGRNQRGMNDSDWQMSNDSFHQEHHTAAGVEVVLSNVCIITSMVSLCINIAVIVWTGSHKRSFGSMLMLLLCITLICHYLFFFGVSMTGSTLCVIRGVLLDVSTKCVFLCMQVLIFDILRAMWPSKSGTGMHDSVKRADQRKRFFRYCLYVFGLPWLFVVPGLLLDSFYPTALVAPLYGVHVCYISSKYGKLVFQYVPVCVIFVVNLVLCALTIKYIRGIKKMRNVAIGKSDASPNDKESREQTYLYMRLILLAGVSWSFGLINAFWGGYVLRLLTILSDGLLGLFVALSYLGSRSIRMILKAKLCGSYEPTTTATSVPSSSSATMSRKRSMPNKRPSAAVI